MSDKTPPPQQPPVPQLIDNLAAAGVPDERREQAFLKKQFQAVPYSLVSTYPCVEYKSTDPFQPVAGGGMDVHFNPSVTPFEYTIVVVDISVTPSVVVFQGTATYGTSPATVTIPNKVSGVNVFTAGHDYLIILYPSFTASFGGADVTVPIGCITSVVKTCEASLFKKAVYAGCEFGPAWKH